MAEDITASLERRIAELTEENVRLRAGFFHPSALRSVVVPEPFEAVFDEAESSVRTYFQSITADPSRGFIEISGQRYILLRASAVSIDFLETIAELYADRGAGQAAAIGRAFLFDIAHTVGRQDARAFHKRMGLAEPLQKLSAGPIHFAFTGWALVDIKPESAPRPDSGFVLRYDHPYSFEADAWLRAGKRAATPVCIMNAGYSSGWCEESFGLPLTSVEVSCRARGDETCSFVMAPPSAIEERLREFGVVADEMGAAGVSIPVYLERKGVEDALLESEQRLRRIIEATPLPVMILREEDGALLYANDLAVSAMGSEAFAPGGEPRWRFIDGGLGTIERLLSKDNGTERFEEIVLRKPSGDPFYALASASRVALPGAAKGVLVAALDITERKEAEWRLRELQERLITASREQGMAEVATTVIHNIGNVLNSLNASVTLLQKTIAAAPVENLSKAAQLLRGQPSPGAFLERDPKGRVLPGYFTKLGEKITEEHYILSATATRLSEDLEHLRGVVETQQAMAKRTPIYRESTLGELADEAMKIATAETRRTASKVTVTGDRDARLIVERHYVVQILVNLVKNAIESVAHSRRRDGRVAIELDAGEDAVSFSVVDDGHGISEEDLPRIFRHGFTTKESGHGFGLHSAALTARILRGSLEARSEGRERGATFVLTLPKEITGRMGGTPCVNR